MSEFDPLVNFRARLPEPDRDEVSRAKEMLLDEMRRTRGRAQTSSPSFWVTSRRAIAPLALGLVLLVAVLTATPPGRALAGDVGEFIGFGGSTAPDYIEPAAPEDLARLSILKEPIEASELPVQRQRELDLILSKEDQAGLMTGTVELPGGTMTVVGNPHAVCFTGTVEDFSSGSCASVEDVLAGGLSVASVCGPQLQEGQIRISGIVPNGIPKLALSRDAGSSTERLVPVVGNAFSVVLDPPGVVLRGVGSESAEGFTIHHPLDRIPLGKCAG